MAVLSLTWKSPYVDRTVFILRRPPDSYKSALVSKWKHLYKNMVPNEGKQLHIHYDQWLY